MFRLFLPAKTLNMTVKKLSLLPRLRFQWDTLQTGRSVGGIANIQRLLVLVVWVWISYIRSIWRYVVQSKQHDSLSFFTHYILMDMLVSIVIVFSNVFIQNVVVVLFPKHLFSIPQFRISWWDVSVYIFTIQSGSYKLVNIMTLVTRSWSMALDCIR